MGSDGCLPLLPMRVGEARRSEEVEEADAVELVRRLPPLPLLLELFRLSIPVPVPAPAPAPPDADCRRGERRCCCDCCKASIRAISASDFRLPPSSSSRCSRRATSSSFLIFSSSSFSCSYRREGRDGRENGRRMSARPPDVPTGASRTTKHTRKKPNAPEDEEPTADPHPPR